MEHLEFASFLYLGDSIQKEKLDGLKKNLQMKPLRTNVFLITFASNQIDLFDIIHSRFLIWKKAVNNYVIGIAGNYDEAVALVKKIVEDCYQERKDARVREFLVDCSNRIATNREKI